MKIHGAVSDILPGIFPICSPLKGKLNANVTETAYQGNFCAMTL